MRRSEARPYRDNTRAGMKFEAFSFGSIRIDGVTYEDVCWHPLWISCCRPCCGVGRLWLGWWTTGFPKKRSPFGGGRTGAIGRSKCVATVTFHLLKEDMRRGHNTRLRPPTDYGHQNPGGAPQEPLLAREAFLSDSALHAVPWWIVERGRQRYTGKWKSSIN